VVVTVRRDSRRLPDAVSLEFRGPGGQRTEPMERLADRRFGATWRGVVEPFEFLARASRAATPWIAVELVDRPAVERLELVATSPPYAGAETEPLPPGRGPYYLLKGSTLAVRGTANKPLSQAALVTEGSRHAMAVSGERDFAASLAPGEVTAGVYRVELADTERIRLPDAPEPGPLRSKRPTRFTVKIKPDRPPQVLAKLVGVGAMVVPGARVPFECRVDDDYAVTGTWLRHQWQAEEDESGAEGSARLDAEESDGVDGADGSTARRAASFASALELPPLAIPAQSQLRFFIEATDNDDVSGPKSGKSSTFVLRVVSEDRLRVDLLRREKEHRIALERHVEQQEVVATECEAMLAAVRGEPALEAEKRQLLVNLARRQKRLGTSVGTLADRFAGIVAEVENNRLEEADGPLQRRLREQVVAPMRAAAGERMPQAAESVDRAWRRADRADRRNAALSEAIAAQQSILAELREVLTHLVKVEGFQEAVNLLYEIQKAQKDVLDRTDAERRKRIREILDQGGKPQGEEP
jgi:hypothetical protein